MMATGLPGTPAPAPAASRGPSSAHDGAPAGGDEGDFAGLLDGPPAPAAKPANPDSNKTTDRGATRDAAPADREAARDDEAAPADPALPDQLLALLGLAPAQPTPGATAAAATVAAAGTRGPLDPAAARTAAALAAAVPGADAGQTAPVAEALPPGLALTATADGNAAPAAPGVAAPGLPLPPATGASASGDAPAVADFAQALGLAAATEAGDAGAPTVPDAVGDGADSSALFTTAATGGPAPARATAAGANPLANPLALPADPGAGFDDGFGARIGWLAEQRIGHAELRLSPEHLGPIDVRLQMDGTRVSAEFQSPHADVRHALESSIGRLRDLLGQQGLQLANADIGHGRGDQNRPAPGRAPDATPDPTAEAPTDRSHPLPARSRGLLDTYA